MFGSVQEQTSATELVNAPAAMALRPLTFWLCTKRRDGNPFGSSFGKAPLHGRHICRDMGHGLPAILACALYDGGTHDDSVRYGGHGGRLLRRGDPEADGAGDIRIGRTMRPTSVVISVRTPVTPREDTQ